MRQVGIKQLKNELSRFVRAAAGGETVLVADRGRVVASLGPPVLGGEAETALAGLVARGVVTPATTTYLPASPADQAVRGYLAAEIEADRADRC